MATTGVNICKLTNAALVGSTVQAAGTLTTLNKTSAKQQEDADYVARLDRVLVDFGDPLTPQFAKNGGAVFNALSGTTKVSLDLTDLTSTTTSSAGDTSFATWNQIVVKNTGAADLTIAPGSSNPARGIAAGTTPTITVPAGGSVTIYSPAGYAIDSTHKVIDITPTAGGSVAVCVGGA